MPFDSTSSSVNSVSIPVTPSDVGASLNVAPTSTKQKKKNKSATQVTAVASAQVTEQEAAVAAAAVPDWVYDPNEPRYCLCNQIYYGEMVGCDNPESYRMVSLWLCWINRRSEGKMVLSAVPKSNETTEKRRPTQMIFKTFWNNYC
ncbi:inhibitor of growth protein 3-like [Montipora capricornis]|uniref:inhibitor of growth protein 3-like n=1 Tax=Montipora capricornis TaxID=246305 RepID=UPI0035F1D8E4